MPCLGFPARRTATQMNPAVTAWHRCPEYTMCDGTEFCSPVAQQRTDKSIKLVLSERESQHPAPCSFLTPRPAGSYADSSRRADSKVQMLGEPQNEELPKSLLDYLNSKCIFGISSCLRAKSGGLLRNTVHLRKSTSILVLF